MDAYLTGLEQARDAGLDLSTIHSVASFFVSRVDTEVDKRLDDDRHRRGAGLRGKAAVANARLAYAAYEEVIASDRWRALAEAGANAQRPLWASTGVKNDAYPDTLYVTELVVADTVNTMPEKTWTRSPTTARSRATRSPGRRTPRSRSSTQLAAVGHRLRRRARRARARGRREVREVLGTSWSRPSRARWSRSTSELTVAGTPSRVTASSCLRLPRRRGVRGHRR